MKGKAYANRKKEKDRPLGDFYSTPKSLIWEASHIIEGFFSKESPVLEPCFGEGAISQEIEKLGFDYVITNDLYKGGVDYLSKSFDHKQVITNPPFSMWDEFVEKAKQEAQKVIMIGRLNYFGTSARSRNGIWDHLKEVHCFNRYVDFRTPYREDGLFHVGAMATAWFVWDMDYTGSPKIEILDVQPYAKLGTYKEGSV